MKKIIFLLLLSTGLAGCSQGEAIPADIETTDNEAAPTAGTNTSSDTEPEQADQQATETASAENTLDSDIGEIEMLGLYQNVNSSKEDGSYLIDFEGFLLKTTPMLVIVRPNEENMEMFEGQSEVRAIMLTQSGENTTEGDVDYLGSNTVITDTKEQISESSGLSSTNAVVQTYYGKVQAEGFSLLPLKESESTPQKITIMFDPPYKIVNDAVDGSRLGEKQRIDFTYADRESLE